MEIIGGTQDERCTKFENLEFVVLRQNFVDTFWPEEILSPVGKTCTCLV